MFDIMLKKLENGRILFRDTKTGDSVALTASQALKEVELFLNEQLEKEEENEAKIEDILLEAQNRLFKQSKE